MLKFYTIFVCFFNPDSLLFGSVPVGDSAMIAFNLNSNSSRDINITGFFNREGSYTLEHALPFILSPYSSESIMVKFKPNSNGFFKDTLHIRSDTDTSRIAQLLILFGHADTTALSITEEFTANEFVLEQNYPNPFNPSTTIYYSIPELSFVTLKVYDVLGSEVITLVNEEKPVGTYEITWHATNLPSGVYFYRLQAGSFAETKKMVLMK